MLGSLRKSVIAAAIGLAFDLGTEDSVRHVLVGLDLNQNAISHEAQIGLRSDLTQIDLCDSSRGIRMALYCYQEIPASFESASMIRPAGS